MHRLLAVVIALGGCGGSSRPPVAPAPVKAADTVAMADPCDGGEIREDPCAGGEAKEQVAIADPCDGGEAQGGLGLRGTGEGGGGTGEGVGLGTVGTIGSGRGTGSGYGAGKGGLGSRSTVPQVTLGKHTVTGKLPADVVRRIVRAQVNQVRYCYEKLLTARPDAAGVLTLELVITPNGDVAEAKANGVTPDLESCVTRRAMTWKFPKPTSGIVKVSYPMTFALPPP